MAKHWHAMNGSSGCIPDNNETHSSKMSAIQSLCSLFDNERGMYTALKNTHIYYFDNPRDAGADYAEICECHEDGCEDYE